MARTLTRALSLVLGHGAFFSIESVAEMAESFPATKAEMEALAYDDSLVITAASEINGQQIIVGSRITHINGEFVQSSRELHPSQATAPPGAAVDNLIQLDFMLPAASELAVRIREMGEELEEMEAELRAANDRASKAEDALDDLQEEEDASPNRKQRRTDRKRQRNEKEGKKVLLETQADWQRTKTRILAKRLKDHGHYAPLVAEVTLRLQQKIGGTVKTDSDSIRLIKSGIVDEIIRALGRHAADPDVQGNASQLLLTLMSFRTIYGKVRYEAESSIGKSMAKHGPAAARELLLAIEDESSDANLVAANCSTLSILCRRGPCAVLDAVGDSATRGVDVLADAMRSHRGDERVQLSACQIFRVMCRDHTHGRARAVRNVGALDLALDAVRQHYADPEIAQEAQGLILCVPGDDYHRDRPALAMPVAGQPAKESRSQKKRSKRSKQKVGFVQSTDLYRFRSDSGPTKTKNGCVFVGERSLIFYSSDPRLRDCGQDSQAILAEVMYMQLEEFMVEKKQDKKETQEGKQWFELRTVLSWRNSDLKIRTYEHQGQTFKDLVHQKRLALQRKVADVREESRRQKNRELFQLVQDLDRATAASAADHARKKAEIQASIQAKQDELEQTRYEQEEFRRGLEGQLAATHAVVEDQTFQMQAELNHKQLQATEEVEGLMRQLEENRLRAQQEERDLLAKERENRDRIRATAAAEAKQREEDAASRKQSVEITTEQIKRLKLSDGAITTQLVSIDVGDIIVGSHILSINGKPVQSQCEIDAVLAETDDGQDSEPEYLEAVAAMDLEELVEECDLEDVKWEHLDDEDSIRAALIAHSVGPSAAGGGAVAQAMHKVALEIPRSTTLAEQGRTCVVCFDDEIKRVDGYECDGDDRHFICDECLAGHVKAKMQEDMAHLEAAEGKVFCPCKTPGENNMCAKSKPLSEADILRHAADSFPAYRDAQQQLLEKKLGEDIRKEERQRLEQEQVRLAAMDKQQREVHQARLHIVDELLTLRCPRCQAAFVDFSGCFALKCSHCPCGFCAWCLEDCGDDAHRHVASCPESKNPPGDYFGTKPAFDRHHLERRQHKVNEYLFGLSEEIRPHVVEQCRGDLQDLEMHDVVRRFAARAAIQQQAPPPQPHARPVARLAGGGFGDQDRMEDADHLLALQLAREDGGGAF